MSLNVDEALIRVRERIHDRNGYTFDDAEVLRTLDDVVRGIFTMLRIQGDSVGLDSVDVATTSLTLLERGVYQTTLSDQVADIQLVELVRGDGSLPYQIPRISLEHKDLPRGTFGSTDVGWHPAARGSINIRGVIDGWATVRVWYVRLIPALFRAPGNAGSSATSLVVSAPVGAFKARDGLYVGSDFEATSGTNLGQVRRCSAHVGSTLTVPAFGATMASIPFSMVLPVADEHCEYLIELAGQTLLRRQGSPKEQAMVAARIGELQLGFEAGLARRSSGEPPRLFSSRNFR